MVYRCGPIEGVESIWLHPQLQLFPSHQRGYIVHAQNLAVTMYAAVLLYNLMLAEESKWEEKIDEYHDSFQAWREEVADNVSQFSKWDRDRFWEIVSDGNPRIPGRTIRFVKSWLENVFQTGEGKDVTKSANARALISEREYKLKRARARLHNPRSLENWRGQAGTARLDYRWSAASNLINDVLRVKER
mgnify:CR=1 FL=1